jgi:hypothetical protein
VRFVRSALTVFAPEIARHRKYGPCGAPAAPLPLPASEAGWR